MPDEYKKRFYFIKLKKDFFKRHDVRYLESISPEYALIYLKLLCESADHNGELRFNERVPYNTKMLAVITDTDQGVFNEAYEVLRELGLLVVLEDETIFLPKLCEMVDSNVDSVEANKKRQQKRDEMRALAQQKIDEQGNKFPTCGKIFPDPRENNSRGFGKSGNEIPESIDIRDKNKTFTNVKVIESTTPTQIVELYARSCPSFPEVKSLSEARKKAINARLKVYSLDDFETLFKKAEESSFLKGSNDRNWTATFDWLIKDANMAKVLDGNYDDKPRRGKKKNAFNEFPQNDYDFNELERKLIQT